MSAQREVEICCDGDPSGAFFCTEYHPIYAHTAAKARAEAREAGWLVSQPGGKDYCPAHRPAHLLQHVSGGQA